MDKQQQQAKRNNLNSILLEGNLTRDPRYRETSKGTPVCTFSVASNRYFRQNEDDREEVSFFDVETWSKLAEACGAQLTKGRGVRVVGRLKQDRWKDNDGNNHSRVLIVADHVDFKPVFSRKTDDAESTDDPLDRYAEQVAPQEAVAATF